MGKLTAKAVMSKKTTGMHGDGQGLYLNISAGGTKSWILRVTVKGDTRRREIGLGGLNEVSLSEARQKAGELRAIAKAGRDPLAERDRIQMTFERAAREYHKSLAPTFRSEKHSAQWLSSLINHAFPLIGDRKVETIARDDILRVLSPIWVEKHPTAKRLKQRIVAVLDWTIGQGYSPGPNPVDGALHRALPSGKRKPRHHPALPWRELPGFVHDLREREAIAARCLEFVILTATRSGEARGALWNEIDLERGTWTIPAERMKAEEEHRVPLSDRAIEILRGVQGLDAKLVFPSPSISRTSVKLEAKQLSVNAFRPLLERMGVQGITVHGFRSTFRDWAAEHARADRTVAEAALAHRVAGVEGAYFRSDLFERRRELMDAWERFISDQSGAVVEMVRA